MPKVKIKKTKYYTMISNFVLNDIRLTWRAKGLWAFMMSLPDDWDYSVRGLATRAKDGRDSVTSGLNELKKYGYLTVDYVRDDHGRIIDTEYTIYEKSQLAGADAETEVPRSSKPKASPKKKHPSKASQNNGQTVVGNPDTVISESKGDNVAGNPDTVTPYPENQPPKPQKVAGNPDTATPDTVTPDTVIPAELNKQGTKYIYNQEKQGINISLAPQNEKDEEERSEVPPEPAKDSLPNTLQDTQTKMVSPSTPPMKALKAMNPMREYAKVDPKNPPTTEEIEAYCVRIQEAGFPMTIDPDEFVDYYYSKGWDKIRDWKAAIRNWQRNRNKQQDGQTPSGAPWSQDPSMSAPRNQGTDSRLETLRKLWNQYDQEEQEAAKKES